MSREGKSVNRGWYIIIAIGVLFGISDIFLISDYVIRQPQYLLPAVVMFVIVPIIGFIAWWYVGYQGRPINPTSTHPLMDDPKYQGYQDYD